MRRIVTRTLLAACTLGLLAAVLPGRASAETLKEIFARANHASFSGHYDAAIADYHRLLDAGVDDPDVCFDLATAYARQGHYGRAILYFERALRLRPGDDGAEKGLAAAQAALGRRRAEAQGEATVAVRPPLSRALVRPFSESTLAWLVLAFDAVFFGVLIARRSVRGESTRLGLGIAAPLTGLLLVLAIFGLAVKSGFFAQGAPGIVLEEHTMLREGPDSAARTRGEALEGERARILEHEGNWLRVQVGPDRQGWVHQGDVGAI